MLYLKTLINNPQSGAVVTVPHFPPSSGVQVWEFKSRSDNKIKVFHTDLSFFIINTQCHIGTFIWIQVNTDVIWKPWTEDPPGGLCIKRTFHIHRRTMRVPPHGLGKISLYFLAKSYPIYIATPRADRASFLTLQPVESGWKAIPLQEDNKRKG